MQSRHEPGTDRCPQHSPAHNSTVGPVNTRQNHSMLAAGVSKSPQPLRPGAPVTAAAPCSTTLTSTQQLLHSSSGCKPQSDKSTEGDCLAHQQCSQRLECQAGHCCPLVEPDAHIALNLPVLDVRHIPGHTHTHSTAQRRTRMARPVRTPSVLLLSSMLVIQRQHIISTVAAQRAWEQVFL